MKKAEKSSLIVFYKEYDVEPNPETEDDDGRRLVVRYSNVFNVAQVENFTLPDMPATSLLDRDHDADTFFTATGADIRHGGARAFYRPSVDIIQMPDERLFRGSEYGSPKEDYYCVLAHELTHTGLRLSIASIENSACALVITSAPQRHGRTPSRAAQVALHLVM